jgi:mono/diheme cytochrome c family protein
MRTFIAVLFASTVVTLLVAQVREHGSKSVPPDPDTTHLISSLDGSKLFQAYCAVCHGLDARGSGPMAPALKTAPPDLTRLAARNGGTFPAARMARVITGDEPLSAGHGSRNMPIWGPIFSQIAWDQDLGRIRVHNLAGYLERIQER